MVIEDVDIWAVLCETLVLLVDFKVVDVTFETPGVGAILDVGFTVVAVMLLEVKAAEVDEFTALPEGSLVLLEGTGWVLSVELAVEFCRDTIFLVSEVPSGSSALRAVPSSASTCSAPRRSTAQAPRGPSPIVPRAGRGGLVSPQPRWRRQRRGERPLSERTEPAARPSAATKPLLDRKSVV